MKVGLEECLKEPAVCNRAMAAGRRNRAVAVGRSNRAVAAKRSSVVQTAESC